VPHRDGQHSFTGWVRVFLSHVAGSRERASRPLEEDAMLRALEIGLTPTRSARGPLFEVCRIFVANTADWAGFADWARL
jgi:hypothetical protein